MHRFCLGFLVFILAACFRTLPEQPALQITSQPADAVVSPSPSVESSPILIPALIQPTLDVGGENLDIERAAAEYIVRAGDTLSGNRGC